MAAAAGGKTMRAHLRTRAAIVGAAVMAIYAAGLVAGQAPAAPAFTEGQATAGGAAYQANCAACHQADLSGRNEAPPLSGANFMNTWGRRTTKDLFDYMAAAMPPSGATLGAEQYAAITSFILQSNGATPGAQALTAQTAVPIASIATGRAPQLAQAAGRGAAPGADQAAGGRGQAPAAPRGLTIAGEVKNFTPVTDAMLKNPAPGDWLMARRNYQGWSYSPLNDITRANVKDLHLAWVWAMYDGAASQPTPLVHDGIMYLVNPLNILQALDAKTGELIWENHIGPEQALGIGAMRNMSIYQDKLFFTTTDARLSPSRRRPGRSCGSRRLPTAPRATTPRPRGRS
jgi:alcohol dehydrogenase (cytochrome c)